MDEILTKIPDFENKVYIIGGPRQQALEEAMEVISRPAELLALLTAEFHANYL